MKHAASLLCFVVLLPTASARAVVINFVDAVMNTTGSNGNTKLLVNGTPTLFSVGVNIDTTKDAYDDKWTYRTLTVGSGLSSGALNGNSVFEQDTNSDVGESAHPLVTTITGLAPGNYKFYVFYWGDTTGAGSGNTSATSNWDISVRVGASGNDALFKQSAERIPDSLGSFSTYSVGNVIAHPVPHAGPSGPLFSNNLTSSRANPTLQLSYATLGQFVVDATGSLNFYIGGPDVDSDNNRVRTWYEGIGYELFPVVGDFDSDGDVDGADFVAWQTNFPKANAATLAQGDADNDGDVDGADFVIWQSQFPHLHGNGVSSVPEPQPLLLAMIGGFGFLVLGWQRRDY